MSDARHVALWSVAFNALAGTPWESEDEAEAARASAAREVDLSGCARALRGAYHDKLDENEETVRAALRACVQHWGPYFTPEQFTLMASGYAAYFADMHYALSEHLDDLYGAGSDLRTEWFKEEAPIWDAPKRDSEIWVSGSGSDAESGAARDLDAPQWVFQRPQ